jgi:hypothetical protein
MKDPKVLDAMRATYRLPLDDFAAVVAVWIGNQERERANAG